MSDFDLLDKEIRNMLSDEGVDIWDRLQNDYSQCPHEWVIECPDYPERGNKVCQLCGATK